MEQMSIAADKIISVNYQSNDLPYEVKALRPVVFREEEDFCCLLGPDPQARIFGCGTTAEAAILDWQQNLRQPLTEDKGKDDVAAFVRKHLNVST